MWINIKKKGEKSMNLNANSTFPKTQKNVLIMDEPSAALDLVCKERIHNYILDFRSRGGIVIIATHEEQEINLCDKHYIMKNGVLSPLNYDGNVHKLVGMLMNSQSVLNEAF